MGSSRERTLRQSLESYQAMTNNIFSDTTIVLPAYNEERSIAATIDEIRSVCSIVDILVVDNNSTDHTGQIALEKKARVVCETRQGKGFAFRRALQTLHNRYIVLLDADATYPAEYIYSMLHILSHARCPVVVCGIREKIEPGAMTKTNRFGNVCLSLIASLLYRQYIHDVCTGMWAFKDNTLDRFSLTSPAFTLEADLFVNAVRQGCKIAQIPIHYRARQDGDLPKLKVLDGFRIGWFLIRKRFFR